MGGMPLTDTNLLGDAITTLRDVWRHRKGYEIPAIIMDTVDALWPVDRPRPLLIKGGAKRTPSGWHFIFTLRPGVTYREMEARLEYFIDACRLPATIAKVGGYAHLHIYNDELAESYPYEWNHDAHKGLHLPFPVGYAQDGLEIADLVKFPHLLVAGETGYGKSTLLLVLILSLLPIAKIAIIDLKRLQFPFLQKHCALAKKEDEALLLLKALNNEMERRIDILLGAGVDKITKYKGEMPFIVLVIDEVAEIQDKQAIYYIDRIVRLARAVGISVVAATQRPSKKVKVFEENCRDMFAGRICYLMPDEVSSRLVLGETCSLAAHIPAVPGRGIYKFGTKLKEIQTMNLSVGEAKLMLRGRDKVNDIAEWTKRPGTRLLPR
jgi:S-DNA-T family DNA segregation ATPase FtsK/SpoIIIE